MSPFAGVPFIALEYQPKVRDFAASVGMEDWVVSTRERDPAALIARIEALALERARVKESMAQCHDDLRSRLAEFVSAIKRRAAGARA